MTNLKEAALMYHDLGMSMIPVNDKKRPLHSWTANQFEAVRPNGNFTNAYGVAVCCGKVSGNLETIDIDCKYDITGNLFDAYKRLVHEQSPGLLKKMVLEKTQNNGYHLMYRCPVIEGNKKLASRPSTPEELAKDQHDKQKVLIETRGEGGYVVIAPSPGYELVYSNFDKLQVITPGEREILLSCARSLNEIFVEEKIPSHQIPKYEGESPLDAYCQNGDVQEVLEANGWVFVNEKGLKQYFRRPGDTDAKHSAEFHTGKRLFYVWTSSTVFDNEKAYNPAQVLCKLNFGGDFSKCSKWLLENGYGARPEKKKKKESVYSHVDLTDGNYDFLVPLEETDDYLESLLNGTFEMGLTTGLPSLDKFFLFKRGNLVIINGSDNVGKSTVILYLMLLASLNHDWRWIVLANENSPGYVKRKLIEFYTCTKITDLDRPTFTTAKSFVDDHFSLIKSEELYNYKDVLNMAEKTMQLKKYDGLLIDPYNSLKIELNDASKLNTHEYHYEAASEIRSFAKKHKLLTFLNCHVVTQSLRTKDDKGFQAAPRKEDTEGGGKFANKADEFITIHRLTQHPNDWMVTQIHVRKVKELETGGSLTPQDSPFLLRMINKACAFVDVNSFNPVTKQEEGLKSLSSPRGTYNFSKEKEEDEQLPF